MRILALALAAVGVLGQSSDAESQFQSEMVACMQGAPSPPTQCVQLSTNVSLATTDPSAASTAALNTFCGSPCVPQLKSFYAAIGPCLSTAMTKYTNAVMVEQNVSQAVATQMTATLAAAFTQIPAMLDLMCTKKDGTDEYCMTSFTRMATDLSASTGGNATTQASICNHWTNLGCCLNTLDQIYKLFAVATNVSFITELACPGVAVPPPCITAGKAAAALSATITLLSVNFGNIVSPDDRDAVIAGIRSDLATCVVGSSATSFTIGDCTGNPAKCTVSLRGADNAATTAQEGALKACLAGSPSFPATTAALSAIGQPASGTVSLAPGSTVSTVTYGTGSTNDARAAVPALFSSVAVFAAWMLA